MSTGDLAHWLKQTRKYQSPLTRFNQAVIDPFIWCLLWVCCSGDGVRWFWYNPRLVPCSLFSGSAGWHSLLLLSAALGSGRRESMSTGLGQSLSVQSFHSWRCLSSLGCQQGGLKTASMVSLKVHKLIILRVGWAHILVKDNHLLSWYFTRQMYFQAFSIFEGFWGSLCLNIKMESKNLMLYIPSWPNFRKNMPCFVASRNTCTVVYGASRHTVC